MKSAQENLKIFPSRPQNLPYNSSRPVIGYTAYVERPAVQGFFRICLMSERCGHMSGL
jgi:hypothetical protein